MIFVDVPASPSTSLSEVLTKISQLDSQLTVCSDSSSRTTRLLSTMEWELGELRKTCASCGTQIPAPPTPRARPDSVGSSSSLTADLHDLQASHDVHLQQLKSLSRDVARTSQAEVRMLSNMTRNIVNVAAMVDALTQKDCPALDTDRLHQELRSLRQLLLVTGSAPTSQPELEKLLHHISSSVDKIQCPPVDCPVSTCPQPVCPQPICNCPSVDLGGLQSTLTAVSSRVHSITLQPLTDRTTQLASAFNGLQTKVEAIAGRQPSGVDVTSMLTTVRAMNTTLSSLADVTSADSEFLSRLEGKLDQLASDLASQQNKMLDEIRFNVHTRPSADSPDMLNSLMCYNSSFAGRNFTVCSTDGQTAGLGGLEAFSFYSALLWSHFNLVSGLLGN